jgi:hypothetical protein
MLILYFTEHYGEDLFEHNVNSATGLPSRVLFFSIGNDILIHFTLNMLMVQ